MKLIIVRHGETEGNVNKILDGQNNGKLTEKGLEQAIKLAFMLKNEKLDIIYSSDLKRAKDTANEIAKFHRVPLIFTEDFRERFYGKLHGKEKDVLFYEIKYDDEKAKIHGIETIEELYQRAEKFLNKLFIKHKNDTVLLVGHGLMIRTLIAVIKKIKPEEIKEEPLENTGVNIIEVDENRTYKIHSINATDHL